MQLRKLIFLSALALLLPASALFAQSITSTSPLTAAMVGASYSNTLTYDSGWSRSWSITAGSLPPGLSLGSSSGTISGTPTTAGTYTFTVRYTCCSSSSDSKAFSLTVHSALTISTASLPGGSAGTAYSQTLSATGGSGSYTWSISAGSLPAGLSLSAAGVVSGTPTTVGTSNFTVKVVSGSFNTTKALSIQITSLPSITTASLGALTVGQNVSVSLAASGGQSPYTWSLASGSLPDGVSLSAAGQLSGAPTSAGAASFTVKVTDNNSQQDTKAFTWTVNAAPSITTASLPQTTVNRPLTSTAMQATGGTGSLTWSATGLPSGVTLNAAGQLSGTPTSAGTSQVQFTVTDGNSVSANATLSLVVNAQPSITTSSLAAVAVNVPASRPISGSGGTSPLVWSVSAGSLPSGMTLDSATGVISGTPQTAGQASFTLKLTDAAGAQTTQAYTVEVIALPSITTASLSAVTVGQSVSVPLAVSGGQSPYTWSLASGSLPDGMSLSAAGQLSGAPSGAGTASFTVKVTDNNSQQDTKAYSLTVNAAPSITTASLPQTTVNRPLTATTMQATGGTGSLTWSATGMPSGVTLNAAGQLSGTPAASGTSQVEFTVKDSNNISASTTLSLAVNAQPSITTASLAALPVSVSASRTVKGTDGTAPYSWSVSSGSLPSGMTINSTTGVISGTPASAGQASFTVKLTDAAGAEATQAFTVDVIPMPDITTSSLSEVTVGQSVSVTLGVSGGESPYTWSLALGSLPAGVSVSAAGQLSGSPSSAGSASFTVKVTDNNNQQDTQAFTWTVNAAPAITTSSLPQATVNRPLASTTMQATGGTGTLTWSATGLPSGITLNTAGQLSGTPTGAGASQVQFTVTDSNNIGANATLSLVVNAQPSITTSSLQALTLNAASSRTIGGSGGTAPLVWSVSSGSLPTGMTLDAATGVISGTPQADGQASFTLTLTDAAGADASQAFTLEVNQAPQILTKSLSDLTRGAAGSRSLQSNGGTAALAWSVVSGNLPSGMTLNSATGIIAGTPTAAGSTSFTVRLTDANGATADRALTLLVNAVLALDQSPFAALTQGAASSRSIDATGGTAPLTWSVSSGSLPDGMTLDAATGVVSGMPSGTGAASFTITVTDAAGATASRTFNIMVNASPKFTAPATLEPANTNTSVSRSLSVSGGTAPMTWALVGGSLPPGFTLNASSGLLSGSSSTEGVWTFAVEVTDANGAQATRSFELTISGPAKELRLETGGVPSATAQEPYQFTFSASGGTKPYQWQVTAGSLPGGLELNPATGRLQGTPLSAGDFSFTVTVTDQSGSSRSRTFTLKVKAGPAVRVSPAMLSFAGYPGQPATDFQAVEITSTPSNLQVSASANAPWLHLAIDRSLTPAVLRVTALPSELSAGVYTAAIMVEGPETRTVQVRLEVEEETPSFLAEPASLTFDTHPGAAPESQLIRVRASGPTAPVTVAAPAGSSAWMKVTALVPEAGSSQPAVFSVSVDPSELLSGRRDTFLTFSRGSDTLQVPVTALVVQPRLDFDLSHSGLSFEGTASGVPVAAQELTVLNRAEAPLAWVASASAPWIRIEPPTGTAISASTMTVSVDTRGLPAGLYSGRITVTPQAAGAERQVEVKLRIATGHVPPQVSPAGLHFSLAAGGSAPEQRVTFHNPSAWPVSYTSSVTGDAHWLAVAPASGSIAPGASLEVAAGIAGAMMPGVHRAELVVEFSDGAVRVVEIFATMAEEGCEAAYLVPVVTWLGQHFQAQAGWPAPIEVLVTDNCGRRVETGAGLVSFSAGEDALPLIPGANGLWHATWTPAQPASSVNLLIQIVDPVANLAGAAHLTGSVSKP